MCQGSGFQVPPNRFCTDHRSCRLRKAGGEWPRRANPCGTVPVDCTVLRAGSAPKYNAIGRVRLPSLRRNASQLRGSTISAPVFRALAVLVFLVAVVSHDHKYVHCVCHYSCKNHSVFLNNNVLKIKAYS